MRGVILILISLIALSASTAKADDQSKQYGGDIRSILKLYDDIATPQGRQRIEDAVGGMTTGLLWANAMLRERGQPLLYCQPDKLDLAGAQVIGMMRQAMRDNPKWGDFALGMMVLVTLQRTFPC